MKGNDISCKEKIMKKSEDCKLSYFSYAKLKQVNISMPHD